MIKDWDASKLDGFVCRAEKTVGREVWGMERGGVVGGDARGEDEECGW